MKHYMILPDRRQKTFFILGLLLIAAGFTAIALDQQPYGFGFWGLTAGPLMVLFGLSMQLLVIFAPSKYAFAWLKTKLHDPHIITGWGIFMASLTLYLITLEPTASLWDCSEYIACAYKLQIPHAPGNPLFTMLGRLFALFALGSTQQVAFWVNTLSAVSSAATIMLMFWTLEMMAFKLQGNRQVKQKTQMWPVIISGLIGAGVFAVSDSFWFSAVEAETYALATFFTILPVWAAFKWDKASDQKTKSQWFLLIAFAYGLAIGAHPMALLTIPAVVMIFVLQKRELNLKNLLLAGASGVVILFLVNQVIVLGFPAFLKWLDILLVNRFGLPFNSGVLLGITLLIGLIYLMIRYSQKQQKAYLIHATYGLILIFVGFSTYFLVPIRSNHNPPIDENNPDNVSGLLAYLNRDSYPSRPLLTGPYFDARVTEYKKTAPVYTPIGHKYKITDYRTEAVYDSGRTTIFPRMYSNQGDHIATYQDWIGLKPGQQPTFFDNLTFMVRYQLGHMYWRYFMWNFSGRESDIQHATWLNPFSDLGSQPKQIIHNRGHNNYFMLPFLLGLLGTLFQWKNDQKSFYATLSLFLFMGVILVIYLNSTPNEPRERDYIYVGSYLAFALWTGLGAWAIIDRVILYRRPALGISIGLLLLLIPVWMGYQNFDDHNRSGLYLQIDYARNILASCEPDAILFTGGDNDTFPLWYTQEVEGFRTDVRVIVLSYFNASWYIDQMTRKANQSYPLPFSLRKANFQQGGPNDVLPYVQNPNVKGSINLVKFLQLIRENHPALKVQMSTGDTYNSVPSKSLYLPLDVNSIKETQIVPKEFDAEIPENLKFSMKGNYLEKNALMVLDIIATNHWKRPIYFNYTSMNTIGIEVSSHVVQTGSLFQLLPVWHSAKNIPVESDKMYENLLVKAHYRDLDNRNVYYNTEDYQYRILQPLRNDYNTLAEVMFSEGNHLKASNAANFVYNELSLPDLQSNISWLRTAQILYQLGSNDKGDTLAQRIYNDTMDQLDHSPSFSTDNDNTLNLQFYTLQQLQKFWHQNGNEEKAILCQRKLRDFLSYQKR